MVAVVKWYDAIWAHGDTGSIPVGYPIKVMTWLTVKYVESVFRQLRTELNMMATISVHLNIFPCGVTIKINKKKNRSIMKIKISIDQGLKITGLVVWRGRKPVQWECFKKSFPKSLTADMTLEKCRFRWKEIEDYLVQKVILEYQPEPITEIILEKFMPIKTTNQEQLKRVQPLVKLNIFTGYLLGRFEGFGGASPKVYQVGKGTQSKGTAYFAARDAGIPGGLDQDIYDACYHGILAGCDK